MNFEELPDDVREQMREYRASIEAAYEQEFKIDESKMVAARSVTREALADLSACAVATLREVMEESDSDATRVKAATWVLDKVIGRDTVLDPDDPTKVLVEKLTASE